MIILKSFTEYLLNEEDGCADLGNTSGMGDVVAPIPSDIPGDLSGSIQGSGDMGMFINQNPYFTEYKGKKKKRKNQTGNLISFKEFSLNKI